jgi:hypothetical protein
VARKLPPADNARGGGGGGGATAAGCPLRITRGAAVAAVAPRPTALMAMSAYAHSITWTVADDDDVLTEAESGALIQAVMAMEEAMIEGQGTGETTFDWSTWKKGAWKKVLYATKKELKQQQQQQQEEEEEEEAPAAAAAQGQGQEQGLDLEGRPMLVLLEGTETALMCVTHPSPLRGWRADPWADKDAGALAHYLGTRRGGWSSVPAEVRQNFVKAASVSAPAHCMLPTTASPRRSHPSLQPVGVTVPMLTPLPPPFPATDFWGRLRGPQDTAVAARGSPEDNNPGHDGAERAVEGAGVGHRGERHRRDLRHLQHLNDLNSGG